MANEQQQESERPTIMVPDLCQRHQHDLIVRRLKMHEFEPWQSRIIVIQILLFQHAMSSPRLEKRIGGDVRGSASLVLAEIGCLACWDRDAYRRAVKVLRRGFEHAAQVSQGKATDPDWHIKMHGDAA